MAADGNALRYETTHTDSAIFRLVGRLLDEADPLPLEAALVQLADLLPGEPVIGELIAALQAEGRAAS